MRRRSFLQFVAMLFAGLALPKPVARCAHGTPLTERCAKATLFDPCENLAGAYRRGVIGNTVHVRLPQRYCVSEGGAFESQPVVDVARTRSYDSGWADL